MIDREKLAHGVATAHTNAYLSENVNELIGLSKDDKLINAVQEYLYAYEHVTSLSDEFLEAISKQSL